MSGDNPSLSVESKTFYRAGYNPLAAHEARRQQARDAREVVELATDAFYKQFGYPKDYQPTDEAGNPLPFYEEAS